MAASSFTRSTFLKNRIAACFSNSRAASRLPLLSKSIASRTLVSDRVKSLSGRSSPSTRSSKSSNFKLTIALPRLSTTEAGIGTRFELIRTTSSGSTSSVAFVGRFGEEDVPGLSGSDIGLGLGGLPGSPRLPDWPKADTPTHKQKSPTKTATSQRFNWRARSRVWCDFARATLPILSRPIVLATCGVPAFYVPCAAQVQEEQVKARK